MAGPIRDCLGPLPTPSRPKRKLPAGAWDTHFHVLGPQSKYPYSPNRKYTPPDALLDACLAMHDRLGIQRGLQVHANTHGFDNAVDLDAVARSGGRFLAVVRLNAEATREGCEKLHAQGARGVRFAFNPQHGGTLDHAVFDHVMKCIDGLGWFVELHFEGAALPGLRDWLLSLRVPVVIDHLGRIAVSKGVDDAPFKVMLELARRDNVWVKLSGADRLTKLGPPYADVVPFARALIEAAPDRMLWGSDWPHTGVFEAARMPDDGRLVDALFEFAPDDSDLRKILVDNPNRLLGLSS